MVLCGIKCALCSRRPYLPFSKENSYTPADWRVVGAILSKTHVYKTLYSHISTNRALRRFTLGIRREPLRGVAVDFSQRNGR